MRLSKLLRTLGYHCYLYRLKGDIKGLNLGSGGSFIKGFLNIDANPKCRSDLTARVDKRLKFKNDSVEIIYSSHIFEHIPKAGAARLLQSWHSVLKPGGKLYLCVPDLEALCRVYLENIDDYNSESGRFVVDTATGVMYGGQVNRYDFHYYGYSFATLKPLLESAGFAGVKRFDREKSFIPFQDASSARIRDIPVSLNIAATKA